MCRRISLLLFIAACLIITAAFLGSTTFVARADGAGAITAPPCPDAAALATQYSAQFDAYTQKPNATRDDALSLIISALKVSTAFRTCGANIGDADQQSEGKADYAAGVYAFGAGKIERAAGLDPSSAFETAWEDVHTALSELPPGKMHDIAQATLDEIDHAQQNLKG